MGATAVGTVVGIVGGLVFVLVLVIFTVPWARRRARSRRAVKDVEQVSSSSSLPSPLHSPTAKTPWTSTLLIASKPVDDHAGDVNVVDEKVPATEQAVHDSEGSLVRSTYDLDSLSKSFDHSSASDRTSTTSGESRLSSVRIEVATQARRLELSPVHLREAHSPLSTQLTDGPPQPPSLSVSYPPQPTSQRPRAGLPRTPMEPLIERRESSQSGWSNPTEPSGTRPSSQAPSRPNPALIVPPHNLSELPLGSPVSLAPSHRLISAFERSPLTSIPSVSSHDKTTLRRDGSTTSATTNESNFQQAFGLSDVSQALQSISSHRSSDSTAVVTPPSTAKLVSRPESEVAQIHTAALLRSSEAVRVITQDHQAWPFRSSLHMPPQVLTIPSPPPYPPPTSPLPPTPRSDDGSRARLLRPSSSTTTVSGPRAMQASIRSRSESGARRHSPLRSLRAASLSTSQEEEAPTMGASSTQDTTPSSAINIPLPDTDTIDTPKAPDAPAAHSCLGESLAPSSSNHDAVTPISMLAPLQLRESVEVFSSLRPLSSPPSRRPSGPRRPMKRGRDTPFPVCQRHEMRESLETRRAQSSTLPTYLPSVLDGTVLLQSGPNESSEMAPPPYSSPPDVAKFERRLSPPPRIPSFPPLTPLTLRAIMVALEHEPMPELRLDGDLFEPSSKRSSGARSVHIPVLPSISSLSTLSLGLGRASSDHAQEESEESAAESEPVDSEQEPLLPDAEPRSRRGSERSSRRASERFIKRELKRASTPKSERSFGRGSRTSSKRASKASTNQGSRPPSRQSSKPPSRRGSRPKLRPGSESPPGPMPKSLPIHRPELPARRGSEPPSMCVPGPSSIQVPELPARRGSEPPFTRGREPLSSQGLEPSSRRESKQRPQLAIETAFLERMVESSNTSWLTLRPPSPLRVAKRPRPVSAFAIPTTL